MSDDGTTPAADTPQPPAPIGGDTKEPDRVMQDCGRFHVATGPSDGAPINTIVVGRRFVFSC